MRNKTEDTLASRMDNADFARDERVPLASVSSDPAEAFELHVPCQAACPTLTRVPQYIRAISEGDHARAYEINREDNLFPAILGRICSRPCENQCRHGRENLGESVAICHLKRFAADQLGQLPAPSLTRLMPTSGRRIAVVGAGPAGLCAALHLWRFGHDVTLYEKENRPGGMMAFGIPAFRLPAAIRDAELERTLPSEIKQLFGRTLGKELALDELTRQFDSVVLALGCTRNRKLGIPGQDLTGCYDGLSFMLRANLGDAPPIGRRVVVIGGGFTAIDCARMALRLGASQVTIALRRGQAESSVRREDFEETFAEGIKLLEYVSPIEVLGEREVNGLRLIRNRLVAQESGTTLAEPLPGTEFSIDASTIIYAIGQVADIDNLGLGPDFSVDAISGRTSRDRVYAAGDFAYGSKTVIDAIGRSRDLAERIDADLMGTRRIARTVIAAHAQDTPRTHEWDTIARTPMPMLNLHERLRESTCEVECGYPEMSGATESMRCYLCNLVYHIHEPACIACDKCVDICPQACISYDYSGKSRLREADTPRGLFARLFSKQPTGIQIDPDPCIRCGLCLRACPVHCIHVSQVTLSEVRMPVVAK